MILVVRIRVSNVILLSIFRLLAGLHATERRALCFLLGSGSGPLNRIDSVREQAGEIVFGVGGGIEPATFDATVQTAKSGHVFSRGWDAYVWAK